MSKKGSMADKVYEQIKKDLISNRPARNVLLTEQGLAETYGTSRTPVHEALARLCLEGYIVKYPKKGYLIQSMDYDLKVREKTQLRYFVELGIMWEIIKNASNTEIQTLYEPIELEIISRDTIVARNIEFHAGMAKLSKNAEAVQIVRRLAEETGAHLVFMGNNKQDVDVMEESHSKIVKALLNRDFEKAAAELYEDFMTTVQG